MTQTALTSPAATVTHSPPRSHHAIAFLLVLGWLSAVSIAAGSVVGEGDWWSPPVIVSRTAAAVATWVVVVLLASRCGGRTMLIATFTALVLALVTVFPESWALAGAAVTAASAHAVLAVLITRPAGVLRSLAELVLSATVGVGGAFVVASYDVTLRPFRFRIVVVMLVLAITLAVARRLGHGVGSLGRRGIVLVLGGAVLLVVSVAYAQAIRQWGSPELVAAVVDGKAWVESRLGAAPRPIEAVVGFPALVWGVVIRTRRRQGWWMCAFGALGAAGISMSLVQPRIQVAAALLASGYDIAVGAALGLLIVAADRVIAGSSGRRIQSQGHAGEPRTEPARFDPLL